ncbi:MAG: Eco57I restriction-modification methylase domain-containing protein [Candidatus Hodarchaeota archaeon]
MIQQKNFEEFEKLLSLFEKSTRSNNIKNFKKLIPTIDSLEELFLSSYYNRKKEGIYYTKKEITQFMVSEAIIFVINEKLKENSKNAKKIKKIYDINNLTLDSQQKIHKILSNITICDPACGSGNFLIIAAECLYELIRKLNFEPQISDIKIKILKNLYGYDINEYAIKLCMIKLLAWYFDESNSSFSEILPTLQSNLRIENIILNSNYNKYDIIIGNPPYGNILNQNEKTSLKKEDIFYHDIYCAFLLKSLDLSNEFIVFIVPKSFLLRQGYVKFRNRLLSKVNILKIFDMGSKIFKNATNEVQIIFYRIKNHENRDLQIYTYPKKKIITYKNQITDLLRICFNLKCPYCIKSKKLYFYTFNKQCPHCGFETIPLNRIRIKVDDITSQIINKIEKNGNLNYLNHLSFPKMIRGEEDNGLKHVRKMLKNNSQNSCVFISARNDFKYYYLTKTKSFNIKEIDSKLLKGNNYEYYLKPKLLIKHNNITPEAIYTEEDVCFTSSIYSLLYDDLKELKYLCALINSALIQFYCIYGINNQKDTTINLNQYMIRHLPFQNSNKNAKSEIALKVQNIIENLQMANGKFDPLTNRILKEIDDFIFSLYSITDDEKNIILNNLKKQVKHFESVYKEI